MELTDKEVEMAGSETIEDKLEDGGEREYA